MAEPWDALDLDDSDIASFSVLRRCSRQPLPSQSLSSSQSPLQCPSIPFPPTQPPCQPPLPLLSLIPGPAGALQAAMRRKNCESPHNRQQGDISTQEYIRRVEQDSVEEFSRGPWELALEFVRHDGMVHTTPLSAVKKCVSAERIDKVVAIVKSYTPNGLGDMMVTLKDPTDTIGAIIHRKVLGVRGFEKLIAVGSVLILQKVVVFSSSCASCYLNITRRNMVRVISEDYGIQDFLDENVHSTPAHGKNSEIPERDSSLMCRRREGTIMDTQQSSDPQVMTVTERLMRKDNSIEANRLSGCQQVEKALDGTSISPVHTDLLDTGPKSLTDNWKCQDGYNFIRNTQSGPGVCEGMAQRFEDLDNAEKRRRLGYFSSVPCLTEDVCSQYNWQSTGGQLGRPRKGNKYTMSKVNNQDIQVRHPSENNFSMAENIDDLEICEASDVKKQQEQANSFVPCMVGDVADEDLSEMNDSLKRRKLLDAEIKSNMDSECDDQRSNEGTVTKKQTALLLSKTSVQDWTDDQLGILDMDEI